MAMLTKQKAQKEYVCGICGKTISKGEIYKKINSSHVPKIICDDCKISRSELTNSEYLCWLYELQDCFRINMIDDVEELLGYFEEKRNELEIQMENMTEKSKKTKKGILLQERIDNLSSTIYEMEQISFDEEDSEEEIESQLEDARQLLMALI